MENSKLESLVKEWRDARQAWFDQDTAVATHIERMAVLNRVAEAEHALMRYAKIFIV